MIAASGRTRDVPLPGPGPRPRVEPIAGLDDATDAGCERCHAEIAAEQAGSLHRSAWTNDYFARAYALEPAPFCRKCHAPGADPAREPSLAEKHAGVGCTSCHVAGDAVVGARGAAAREGGHAVLGDPRLATAAACGGCHQFSFPGPPGAATGPMQDTLGEHARSIGAATPCQQCHMPEVQGAGGATHRSHAFQVQGDRAMLGRAVTVTRASLDRGLVRVTLAPGAIGHAFPTGDLFRRVEVRAYPVDSAGRRLAAGSVAVLERTFSATPVGHDALVQVERSDTRLAAATSSDPASREITLVVPATTRRAHYAIVWQRLSPTLAARLGLTMHDQETLVIEGDVSR